MLGNSIYLCPKNHYKFASAINYFNHGKIRCNGNPCYFGSCLLLFGGKKIPELMKGLGSGVKEFKKAAKGEEETPAAKKEDETK